MVTLRQLRYFEAVARVGHFRRAAEECAISQPALSQQIRELEAQLGTDLIERSPGRFALTRQGEEVARRAARILHETQDLLDYTRQHGDPRTGLVRLGVIPSVAPYLLPAVLPAIHGLYPEMQVQLRETRTDLLVAELLQGQLDLILVALPLPLPQPEIESIPLFEDRFLLALPAGEATPGPQRATPELIRQERLLLLEDGHCLRDQALHYCAMIRPDMLSGFGASSLATIVQMVANGYGVTLLPEMCAAVEVRDERIRLLRFVEPQPFRMIGVAWRRSMPRKEFAHELGRLVAQSRPAPACCGVPG